VKAAVAFQVASLTMALGVFTMVATAPGVTPFVLIVAAALGWKSLEGDIEQIDLIPGEAELEW